MSPHAPRRSPIARARLRLPIQVKLATVSAGLTFVILCLFAVVIGAVAERQIRSGFDDELRATAAGLVGDVEARVTADGDLEIRPAPLRGAAAGGALVRVVGRDGRVLYPPGTSPLGPFGKEEVIDIGDYRMVSRPLVTATLERTDPFDFRDGALPPPASEAVAYLQYAKLESGMLHTVALLRLFLAIGVLGGTLLAFAGGLFVARRAMRPIAGLTRAAREVARTRDPGVTLPAPTANDEVADLAHTLEDMLAELSAARGETEAALARQREFVADASHELRTPLTSILANLELLEVELHGEQREMAGSALRSSRRMRRLVADLLLLARADAGREAPRQPLDLTAVAREAAGEAAALSSAHPLSLDLPGPVTVEGAEDDLHRLAANLVENALIHTPPGTPVTVSVRRDGADAVLEVSDRGPGIPPPLRERIFERFARGGQPSAPARPRADGTPPGGSGLGLAIVRAVAQSHDGRVELGEAPGGGARFRVVLPAAHAAGLPRAGGRPATGQAPRGSGGASPRLPT